MPAALQNPRPTHREVTPIRTCSECGCFLRSYKYGDKCDPCDKGETKPPTEADVWTAIADGDHAMRRALFDGLDDLMEAA